MTTEHAAEHDTAAFGLDDPWLAEPPKRSKLRLVLAILLAAAVVFYGGVEVQKRYGTAESAAATGPMAGGFTPPDGATLPGGGQFPGGGAGDDSTDQGTGNQGTGGSDASSVIGTVVSLQGGKLVVEDFGGKKHTITLGSDVRVVLETTGSADDVQRGSTVEVNGQADDSGRVTATTITVR